MTIRKTNNPRFSTAFRKSSLEERFHKSYVKVKSGCWEWVGSLHVTGYGYIKSNKRRLLSHIVSWELHNGSRNNLCVLHKCDNRKCVNPKHLFLGTRKDNNVDRDSKGRKAVGVRHGKYVNGKYVNQPRWRTRPDGSKYFFAGNNEREG